MQNLSAGDLIITVEDLADPPVVVLAWKGRSADRYPGRVLSPFFSAALDHAASRGASVQMRFHGLEHFNSSTITSVIELIQDAGARGVHLVLAYDGSVKWQRLSFDALRVFVRGDGMFELRPEALSVPGDA